MTDTTVHQAVLTAEVLTFLAPQRGGLFVDCTVGLGGHARVLLEHGASRVIGLDRDREALSQAHTALSAWAEHVELHHANYKDVDAVLDASQISSVDGVLADLGVSSLHLDGEGRGFSFRRDEPLDMRMDQSTGQTAADLIRNTSEQTLADIIFKYGEERQSRRIARAIVEARRTSPVTSTGDLASIVRRSLRRKGYTRIDPATRTFQAIRIWVNQELDGLEGVLEAMCRRLRTGARLVVISFHSLEDRIVKHTFRALERGGKVAIRVLTKRPVIPQDEEVERNPRARSAKLRVAERVA
ncbi:MAG: 16S rRNA (cytosine(1402)-N(4))-methyltransferase RsmH [Acidobacteriota bacterium]|nr:16S rRNA (cytosine(1402)-N(4))-methyltransferase RsmH [Acidobacteriota bacterium]